MTELRKSSGVQMQSMPAASAELACSASSSGCPRSRLSRCGRAPPLTQLLAADLESVLLASCVRHRRTLVVEIAFGSAFTLSMSAWTVSRILFTWSSSPEGAPSALIWSTWLWTLGISAVGGELLDLGRGRFLVPEPLMRCLVDLLVALLADGVSLGDPFRLRQARRGGAVAVVVAAATAGRDCAGGQHGDHYECVELHSISHFLSGIPRSSPNRGVPAQPIRYAGVFASDRHR